VTLCSTAGWFRSLLILVCCALIVSISIATTGDESENFYYQVESQSTLNLNPKNTKWYIVNERLQAFSLIKGKITVFSQEGKFWTAESTSLGPSDLQITAFQVANIDDDPFPEILAGSSEPGLIYIYDYNPEQNSWESKDYGKYVWSSITYLCSGNFDDTPGTDILVQNQEGYLHVFHQTSNSLDLIWKSPVAWKQFGSILVKDLDNDSKDEIFVVFSNGGVAILKLVNNAITSVWENYPWGKVLSITSGDWNNDGFTEIMIGTSQKLIYVLGYNDENYSFKEQGTKFNFIADKLQYLKYDNSHYLTVMDSAGKFYFMEYYPQSKSWKPILTINTGKVNALIGERPEKLILWSSNFLISELKIFKPKSFQIIYQNQRYDIKPGLIYKNNNFYISPESLTGIGVSFEFSETDDNYRFGVNQIIYEISKQEPYEVKFNGNTVSVLTAPLRINDQLYFLIDDYETIFKLPFRIDFQNHLLIPYLDLAQ
jgi:hypothetical protein